MTVKKFTLNRNVLVAKESDGTEIRALVDKRAKHQNLVGFTQDWLLSAKALKCGYVGVIADDATAKVYPINTASEVLDECNEPTFVFGL